MYMKGMKRTILVTDKTIDLSLQKQPSPLDEPQQPSSKGVAL